MQKSWESMVDKIDPERHRQVRMFLAIQADEAQWWRDACLAYFSSVSVRAIPSKYPTPAHSLDYYKKLNFRFAPGIGGNP